jgi:predicted nucleotidyltransferase
MVSDDTAKQLHDKTTRGQTLSAKEQKSLENWYASQDAVESRALSRPAGEKSIATLQMQVDAALAQLITVTQRIQETASANEALRRDIAALRRQVVHRLGAQPV